MNVQPRTLEGERDAKGLRFAIVAARFNAHVVDRLLSGAMGTLIDAGANPENMDVIRVPGL